MSDWKGKVTVITGGSSGLGLTIARQLLAAGAHVVLAARDPQRLDQAAREVRAAGGEVTAVPTDVTQDQEVRHLFEQVEESCGRLDGLFHCVGRSVRGNAVDTTVDEFRELWELNFLSAVRCTRAALPQLRQSRGHVIHIGSLASKVGSRYLGAYPVSKFSLAAYAQQLRLELEDSGVHVLLVCPGPIARPDSGERYTAQASDLPTQAQQPGGGIRLKRLDPVRVADRILKACERRQPELVIPSKARLLFALGQLWPSLGDSILRAKTRAR